MYSEIASNKRKTVFIMLFFILFTVGVSWFISKITNDPSLPFYVLYVVVAYILISYFAGAKMILAFYKALGIKKQDEPRLWRIVENLSITEGMPMPNICIMEDKALNAFTTGRNPKSATICVTTGLLETMTDTELEGVISHELGHIKNYDVRVSLITLALVAAVGSIADYIINTMFWFRSEDDDAPSVWVLLIAVVAGIIAALSASLIQLAISRKREFLADATGALTTRYPEGLASALEKIAKQGSALNRQSTTTAHLFFANPLKSNSIQKLFSTHPPIEERIARLRKMGRSA